MPRCHGFTADNQTDSMRVGDWVSYRRFDGTMVDAAYCGVPPFRGPYVRLEYLRGWQACAPHIGHHQGHPVAYPRVGVSSTHLVPYFFRCGLLELRHHILQFLFTQRCDSLLQPLPLASFPWGIRNSRSTRVLWGIVGLRSGRVGLPATFPFGNISHCGLHRVAHRVWHV